MISKHYNYEFDGGAPNLVKNIGDRFYSQDQSRHFNYIMDRFGLSAYDILGDVPCIISGCVATKGAGDTISITTGICYAKYSVTVQNGAWALPPATTSEDIEFMRIKVPVLTDQATTSKNADNATTNYVKMRYNDVDGNTRTRVKKAGTYAYEQTPSYTLVIDDVAPTDYDVVLAEFVTVAGVVPVSLDYSSKSSFKGSGLSTVSISTQADFNSIIERVAANQYQFIDNCRSITLKYLSGGYQMSGALTGGDTWGYIQTNNCSMLKGEAGGYIDMENERGYLEVNTDDCLLDCVDIQGTGTVASAISQSFLLNAHRVIFRGCKTSSRLSNVDFTGFQGSGTALHNITSKYTDCCAYALDGSDKIYGYKDCQNMNGCIGYDLESTGDDVRAFQDCSQAVGCKAYEISSINNTTYGFYACTQISLCKMSRITSNDKTIVGFRNCIQMTSCRVEELLCIATGSTAYGFWGCENMAGCYAIRLIGNTLSNGAVGFSSCKQIVGCNVYDLDSDCSNVYGYSNCYQLAGCKADQLDHSGGVAGKNAYGYVNCDVISGCSASDIDTNGGGGVAEGFHNCNYGAALHTGEAINSGNDWIDTVDAQITNKVSTPSVWT